MATIVNKGLLFELSNGILAVTLASDGEGGVESLLYTVGKGPTRRFTREEISVSMSDEGTRARVVLESGAADGPIVRFTVIVPPIVPGDESSFEVDAAALRSTQNSLFGGPRPGPQLSYETFDLAGTVACAPAEEDVDTCHDWSASHDHMPPGPPTLRVQGTCTFPTTGYKIELLRREPQGINPKDLLLDKIVIEPTGFTGQAVTDVEARYEEVTDVEYDTVTILPHGPSIAVQDVH